jgi:hypothetical protein
MAKNQIEIDKKLIERIRPLAVANEIQINATNLVDLALKVTAKILDNLDADDFEEITGLKK